MKPSIYDIRDICTMAHYRAFKRVINMNSAVDIATRIINGDMIPEYVTQWCREAIAIAEIKNINVAPSVRWICNESVERARRRV